MRQRIVWAPWRWRYIVNVCGLIFVPKQWRGRITYSTLVHEAIHTAQMVELGFVFFYVIYILEWIYRLIFHTKSAYRGLSFEREAYDHEADGYEYLQNRRHFAQWRK